MPAQSLPALPPDGSVTAGSLQNGISYYLVTNGAKKGFADFALVRKGDADTLSARKELVSLPHFNKTVPYRFLTRKNIGCGPEGYISYKEGNTFFRFRNVPIFDQAASDTTLLMLFDLIANKPCQHVVVVAGDITPAQVVEKMKVFSLMVPSRTPQYVKPPYAFTPSAETEYAGTLSPEAAVTFEFRGPRTPDAQIATLQPFMSELFCNELGVILKQRLTEVLTKRRIPMLACDVEYEGSAFSMGDEHFRIRLKTTQEQLLPAGMALSGVLSETAARGADKYEYQLARDAIYKLLKMPQSNESLIDMCISNNLTGSDLSMPASKVAFFSSKTMNLEAEHALFLAYIKAILSDTANMSVRWTGEGEDCDEWTMKTALSSVWNTVGMLEEPTISWKVSERDTVMIVGEKHKSKIKVSSTEPMTGGEMWTFSNGMRTIYKKDQSISGMFSYSMMIKGGASMSRELKPGESAFFPDLLSISNVSGMLGRDFNHLMKMKGIRMEYSVDASDLRIYGSAPKGELPLLMKALQSLMNRRSFNSRIFESYKNFELDRMETDVLDSMMYAGSAYIPFKSKSALTDHLLTSADECFTGNFLKANDGVFVLVGDLPYDSTQKILSAYMGAFRVCKATAPRIPASSKLGSGISTVFGKGREGEIRIGMASQQKYSVESEVALQVAVLAIKDRLNGILSEIGYIADVEYRQGLFPMEAIDIKLTFNPVREEGLPYGVEEKINSIQVLPFIRQAITQAMTVPLGAGEIQSYKTIVTQDYGVMMADMNKYIDAVLMRYSYGKDVITNYAAKINAITPADVKAIYDALLNGRRVEYVVE